MLLNYVPELHKNSLYLVEEIKTKINKPLQLYSPLHRQIKSISCILTKNSIYTVKPRFTAPRFTANPDLPWVKPFPQIFL